MNEFLLDEYPSRRVLWGYSDQQNAKIPVYPLEEILAEKLRSLLQRGKSRDYYDVWALLNHHRERIDLRAAKTIFQKKCGHFSIPFKGVDDFFDGERLAETKRFWERGLAHQIDKLPDFDTVIEECRVLTKEIFA